MWCIDIGWPSGSVVVCVVCEEYILSIGYMHNLLRALTMIFQFRRQNNHFNK